MILIQQPTRFSYLCIFMSICWLIFALVQADSQEPQILWGTEDCHEVACHFKAPNPTTPSALVQQWNQADRTLWKFVQEHVPDVLEHTGSAAFDQHLNGVQAVLRYWEAPEHVTQAGLFHSIYGTEGFQGFALPLTQRDTIRSLIGERAERLCFMFCMLDRYTFDETVFHWTQPIDNQHDMVFQVYARPELGRFLMEMDQETWLDFMELILADWLEQVEGAATKHNPAFLWNAGEAFAYRRTAYQKMSEILAVERAPRLSQVAPQMYQQVMATEAADTRNLVQLRTPPHSHAGQEALAALRANGEEIPENLAPRPLEECVPVVDKQIS